MPGTVVKHGLKIQVRLPILPEKEVLCNPNLSGWRTTRQPLLNSSMKCTSLSGTCCRMCRPCNTCWTMIGLNRHHPDGRRAGNGPGTSGHLQACRDRPEILDSLQAYPWLTSELAAFNPSAI